MVLKCGCKHNISLTVINCSLQRNVQNHNTTTSSTLFLSYLEIVTEMCLPWAKAWSGWTQAMSEWWWLHGLTWNSVLYYWHGKWTVIEKGAGLHSYRRITLWASVITFNALKTAEHEYQLIFDQVMTKVCVFMTQKHCHSTHDMLVFWHQYSTR